MLGRGGAPTVVEDRPEGLSIRGAWGTSNNGRYAPS